MKFALKFALGFFIGALIGAGAALLFAPSSGEEMRTKIQSQVDTQSAKVQEKWQVQKQQMKNRIDKKNGGIQAPSKQAEEVELGA